VAADPFFQLYFQRRQSLLDALIPVDDAINEWWDKYRVLEPTRAELEALESMVAARSGIIQGQLQLDEGMMDALVKRRGEDIRL